MWPHKDLGWWGFVIAVVALLLAYPFSLLANLTSPTVKNWWAARSRAGLQKRIRTLARELAVMEQNPPLTHAEYGALMGIKEGNYPLTTSKDSGSL
jgi:hypothetical protein